MKNKWIELVTFLLMAATVTAGFLTTTDVALIPEEYRKYLPLAIGAIIVLKQLAYGLLDYLDDGIMNKSYKVPTTLLKVLVCLLILPGCVTDASTDAEIRRAQAAMHAAEYSYSLAMIVYGDRLNDPKLTPAQKALTQKILEDSRERLVAERLRLVDIQSRRAAASVEALSPGGDGPPAVLEKRVPEGEREGGLLNFLK